jgi:multiple sugar transport system substrate-binding protein
MKGKGFLAFLLVITLISTLLLTACSQSDSSKQMTEQTAQKEQQTDQKAQQTEKKVKLTMIESLSNPTRVAALNKIKNDFQAENPNYEIEIISPPLEGADQKISQMLMAKSKLDIVEVRYWTVRQFINNEWIAPLDEYMDKWNGYKTIAQFMKDGMVIDNKKWGIPIGSYQRMIYYRSDWLKEAGISIPEGDDWTFDKLYEISKRMTDPSKGRYGWTLRGSGNSYQQFIQMVTLAALGSEKILSPYEPYFTRDKKSIYRTPEAKKGFEAQLKFYRDCSPKDSIAWGFTEQVNAFSSGITCFLMQDSDCVGIFNEKMDPNSWATVPMPVDAETKQGMLGLGADMWGMTSYTEDKDATWKFLAYLGSPEVSTYFCKEYGVIPPHTSAYDIEPSFKTGAYAPYQYMFSKPETYFAVGDVIQPYSGFHSEFGKISDTDIQNVLTGNANMDDILVKWADLWEKKRAESGMN